MKASRLILILAVLMLCGCKAKQTLTTESITVDTSRVKIDSAVYHNEKTDSVSASLKYSDSAVIEFISGGGTISVDSAGVIRFHDVKSIKRQTKSSIGKAEKHTEKNDSLKKCQDQQNGVQSLTESSVGKAKTDQPKWYNRVFIHIGWLCCIAALLYMLFLYLKRKK